MHVFTVVRSRFFLNLPNLMVTAYLTRYKINVLRLLYLPGHLLILIWILICFICIYLSNLYCFKISFLQKKIGID